MVVGMVAGSVVGMMVAPVVGGRVLGFVLAGLLLLQPQPVSKEIASTRAKVNAAYFFMVFPPCKFQVRRYYFHNEYI
jgi:hypothetical protein